MRPALAALMLVLSACGPAPLEPLCAPGESRSCPCPGGAMGIQVCSDDRQNFDPCMMCSGPPPPDAGHEFDDAGVDASAPLDGGPVDAGTDAAIVIVDGGPRDSGARDAGAAACDLYAQEGCGAGQTCRRARVPGMTPATGEPQCETAGPLTESSSGPCRVDGVDLCGRGLFCAAFARCVRYCEPGGAPCPDGLGGGAQVCEDEAVVPYCAAAP